MSVLDVQALSRRMLMILFVCVLVIPVEEVRSLEKNGQFKVYKCCKKGEILDSSMKTCKNSERSSENVSKSHQVQQNSKSEQHAFFNTRMSPDLAYFRGGGDVSDESVWSRWSLGDTRMPNCSQHHTLHLTSRSTSRFSWLQNGSLVLHSPTAQGKNTTTTFTLEEFCVDKVEGSDKTYSILLCPCHKITCVSKCCPSGYMKRCLNFECVCEESDINWSPFHDDNRLPSGVDLTYEILPANEPTCPKGKSLWIDNPIFKPSHYKQYWWEYPNGYLFNNTEVCGDFVVFDHHHKYQTIGYCYTTFLFSDMFSARAWFRVIPTMLLAITLVVLILVPEKRLSIRGWIHSKALLCHTSTLLLYNAVLVAYVVYADVAYCRTTPFILYFCLVAAAFWLNTICINMAWGFGRPQGAQDVKPGEKRLMFLWFSLYAWGSSLAMTAIAVTMWYVRDLPKNVLRPTLMETKSCFWENVKGAGKMGTFAYFYGPVSTLLLVNASLFLFIALRVRHLKRKTSILTREASSQNRVQNQRQALLYIRIVWLMGVAEMTMEVAAWAVHGEGYYFNVAAEVIDVLRAVSIFVLCVCKKRTILALRRRLCSCALVDNIKESVSSGRPRSQQNQMELSQSASQEAAAEKRPTSGSSIDTVSTICDTVAN